MKEMKDLEEVNMICLTEVRAKTLEKLLYQISHLNFLQIENFQTLLYQVTKEVESHQKLQEVN
jgi:hypothetical protein